MTPLYNIDLNTRQARWKARILTEKLLDHPHTKTIAIRGVTRLGY